MIDFYEGWDLHNRLIQDGYLKQDQEISGRELEDKIVELAQKYYNWAPAEPAEKINVSKEQYEALTSQTPNDRLHYIWAIACDWDGYRTVRGLGSLLDEVLDCTAIECKTSTQVIEELKVFNNYSNISDFFNAQKRFPFCWSFPEKEAYNVFKWCDENGYKSEYIGNNYSDDGYPIACVIKVSKNGIIC